MAVSNGVISGSASFTDVKTALSESSYLESVLCTSAKINMWAKFKPEATGGAGPLTLSQRQANNFGLRPATSYMGAELANAVKAGTFTGGWIYIKPGAGNPKRIGDFLNSSDRSKPGYDHKAIPPFPTFPEQTLIINGSLEVHVPMLHPPASPDGYALTLADFTDTQDDFNLADWYFGVLLINTSRTIAATSVNKISAEVQWQVNMGKIPTSYAGTYTGVPILSKYKIEALGAVPAGNKMIGVGSKGVTVKLITSTQAYVLFISCQYEAANRRISYTVSITNNTSTSRGFTTPTIQIATSNTGTGAMTLTTFSSPTVAGNSKWSQSGTVDRPSSASASTYRFCQLSVQGVGSSGWVPFMESITPNPIT